MRKQACVALGWFLIALVLVSCGPTGEPGSTPGSGSPPAAPGTPEPSSAPAECQGRIAFVGRAAGEKDLFVVNADGSGLLNITNGDGPEQSPAWSPDGARIAFARHVGNADLYTIRPDGGGLVRLTESPSHEFSPTWSPDGRRVLFGSQSGYTTELWLVSAEGGEATPLTDSVAHKPDFAWSPDGTRIAYTMLDGTNQGDVYVMPALDEAGAGVGQGTNLTQNPAHDCCAAWAPDGERLLFLSSRDGTGAGAVPAAPGNELAAASGAVRAVTTVMPEPVRDIYLIEPDGAGLTRLTDGEGHARQASWSPAGGQIALVSDRDGNYDVYLLPVPGGTSAEAGEAIRLTGTPEDDRYPAWSPDGACLAFLSYRAGAWGLYVIGASGGGERWLADAADGSSPPSWAP